MSKCQVVDIELSEMHHPRASVIDHTTKMVVKVTLELTGAGLVFFVQ